MFGYEFKRWDVSESVDVNPKKRVPKMPQSEQTSNEPQKIPEKKNLVTKYNDVFWVYKSLTL